MLDKVFDADAAVDSWNCLLDLTNPLCHINTWVMSWATQVQNWQKRFSHIVGVEVEQGFNFIRGNEAFHVKVDIEHLLNESIRRLVKCESSTVIIATMLRSFTNAAVDNWNCWEILNYHPWEESLIHCKFLFGFVSDPIGKGCVGIDFLKEAEEHDLIFLLWLGGRSE